MQDESRLAEFDYVMEHRPGRVHCNADGVSRPICKRCIGKTFTTPWIDEFERADEIIPSLGVRALQFSSEYSNEDVRSLQDDDPAIAPVLNFLEHDITASRNDLRALPLESRIIWSHQPTIQILEGILVRHVNDNVQRVPQTLRRRLFDASHSGPLAAHLGAERMIK